MDFFVKETFGSDYKFDNSLPPPRGYVIIWVCVCVFVCEHDNSKSTKHIRTKFFECISHRLI